MAEQSDKLTGFGSITHGGYLDCLFVHRDYQHQGLATRLLKSIEEVAADLSIKLIYSNVSITARPFFEHNGFVIEQKQTVKMNGVEMDYFRILKVRAVI